jgi:hypothetical protein
MLVEAAIDDHHLDLLHALGFRSVLIVPMRLRDRTLGALTLVSSESGRVLDEFDLAFAEQIAARATVAIENSRLYSERSTIARTLQQSLLPERLPEIPGYELASIYLPALETSFVGGDFYDVWSVGEDWMIVIGDVTGKGIDAAALTALVRHTVRTASEFESSPAALLAFVDRTLKKRPPLSVCTSLCLRVHDDTVTLAAGGILCLCPFRLKGWGRWVSMGRSLERFPAHADDTAALVLQRLAAAGASPNASFSASSADPKR